MTKTIAINAGTEPGVCALTGKEASDIRIAAVTPGTTYEYVATAANGWNAVVIGSKVGWVSGKYSRII